MIDDLASRVALTAAAFLLLATGLSVVQLSAGDGVRDAAEGLATHLARQLDAVDRIRGEVSFHGGVGVEGPLEMPPTLAGASYRTIIHPGAVEIEAEGHRAIATLAADLYPFLPDPRDTPGDLEARRADARLVLENGQRFVVARELVVVDSVPRLLTFVHAGPG